MAAWPAGAIAGTNDAALHAYALSWGGAGQKVADSQASDGSAFDLQQNATGTGTITTSTSMIRVAITARGTTCDSAAPRIYLQLDGQDVTLDGRSVNPMSVSNTGYAEYAGDLYAPAGTHTVTVKFDNYVNDTRPLVGCKRELWLDQVTLDAEPFSSSSFRNTPLSDSAPLDPNSADLASKLNQIYATYGATVNTNTFTVPVYTVGSNFGLSTVQLNGCKPGASSCDSDLQTVLTKKVPVPSWTQLYDDSTDTDSQDVIWQPATDKMWEFWDLQSDPVYGWTAGNAGYMENVSASTPKWTYPDSQSPGYSTRWWGSSGSKIPMLALLPRIAEAEAAVKRPDHAGIDHPVWLSLPATRYRDQQGCTYPTVPPDQPTSLINWPPQDAPWPAQNSDGVQYDASLSWLWDCSGIPEGTRFRLPASLNIDSLGLTPFGAALARAAQRYGLIVTDKNETTPAHGRIAILVERQQNIASGAYNPWTDPTSGIFGGDGREGSCTTNPPGVLCNFPWDKLEAVAVPPVANQW
jgi:Ca-dependent carbohydrate-binding module xylan-binding